MAENEQNAFKSSDDALPNAFKLIQTKFCTQVLWQIISVDFVNGQNHFDHNFKMVGKVPYLFHLVPLNFKYFKNVKNLCLEQCIILENQSHQLKAGKKLNNFNMFS